MHSMKHRLTSKVVWLAVVAQVVLLVALFNPDLSVTFKIVATAIVEIANTLGILNNPTDKIDY